MSDHSGLQLLREQHHQIRTLLAQVTAATGPPRQESFDELRSLLAVHETAEELVLRPMTRSDAPDGEQVAEQRMAEENQAKQALADLEKMDVASPEFEQSFAQFRQDVLAHAEHEESLEFTALAASAPAESLDKLYHRIEMAERTAPTHPHPSATTTTRNAVMGPFAAMADRVRDALSG